MIWILREYTAYQRRNDPTLELILAERVQKRISNINQSYWFNFEALLLWRKVLGTETLENCLFWKPFYNYLLENCLFTFTYYIEFLVDLFNFSLALWSLFDHLLLKFEKMDSKNLKIVSDIIGESYKSIAGDNLNSFSKNVKILLTQRQLPTQGWSDLEIESLLLQLSMMDTNNFKNKSGVGEREGRVFSSLVQKRNFHLGHGIGRSGTVDAI